MVHYANLSPGPVILNLERFGELPGPKERET